MIYIEVDEREDLFKERNKKYIEEEGSENCTNQTRTRCAMKKIKKKRGYHHLSFITTVALQFANDHDFEHLHLDLDSPAEGKIQGRQKKGVLSVYAIFPKERKKPNKKEKEIEGKHAASSADSNAPSPYKHFQTPFEPRFEKEKKHNH